MKNFIVSFLMMLLLIAGCAPGKTEKGDCNIILITIDTLRSDHLSCYGYERETSPHIDKIAGKGFIFRNIIAPSSWTAPSMVSLFTSTYPINHGVIHGLSYRKTQDNYQQESFSDDLITLTELLQKNGYATFGVSSNHNMTKETGFGRGFDSFQFLNGLSAKHVNKVVGSWKNKIKRSGKFFLWVHYMDPHHPYTARSPWIDQYSSPALTKKLGLSNKSVLELYKLWRTFKEDPHALANLLAIYDSEVNYVDQYIGELIRQYDPNNNALVIITADHGEEFWEHGFLGHAFNLYQESLHIPLIIKLPSNRSKQTIRKNASLVDIMPTILQFLDLSIPEYIVGKSLLEKKEAPFSETEKAETNFAELDKQKVLKAIVTPQWKYVYDFSNKTEQLYNIRNDPQEEDNLVDKEPKQATQLKKQLFEWIAGAKKYSPKTNVLKLDPGEKERLKAMGYIQ